MSSSRSEFLRGLSARLERDLALREAERDEAPVPTEPQRIVQPEGGLAPSPAAMADDQMEDASAAHAGLSEPEPDAGSEAAAPAQRPRWPRDPMAPVRVSVDSQNPSQGANPPVSWSEAGMPSRLRDAIASVRRVAHELYQAPGDDDAMLAPGALRDQLGQDGFPPEPQAASDPPAEDRLAGSHDDPANEQEPIKFGIIRPYKDNYIRPDDNTSHDNTSADLLLDDDAAAQEEPGTELVLDDDAAAHEAAPIRLDQATAYPRPRPVDEATHERIGVDDVGHAKPVPADEALELPELADPAGQEEREPGLWEDPEGHPPVRHGTMGGYGIHLTAFAVAVAFVALAGLGLGLLSGGGGSEERPPAQDTLTAAPAPARPSEVLAELPPPTQQSELTTVRVAPPPGAALAEPAPAARVSTPALPLPPPPKPALRQSAAEQPPGDEPPAGAATAPAENEDAGGLFQPLFAKLPASHATADQVLVHYMATAAGAPAIAMHLVRQLKAEGFPVEARGVQFPIAINSIRYFFASDRDQAEALRASLANQMPGGAEVLVMDFTSYEPKPQQGHLEVWLRP